MGIPREIEEMIACIKTNKQRKQRNIQKKTCKGKRKQLLEIKNTIVKKKKSMMRLEDENKEITQSLNSKKNAGENIRQKQQSQKIYQKNSITSYYLIYKKNRR